MAAGLETLLPHLYVMIPGSSKEISRHRSLQMSFACACLILLLQVSSWARTAQSAAQSAPKPLTLDEVANLIKQNKKDTQPVLSALSERGVDFDLDEKTEKKLRKAGADEQLLPEIWKATPKGKANMASLLTTPTGNEIKAPTAQALALQDIQEASDPAHCIQLSDDFAKKYPESPLLSYVYTSEAKAYQDQGQLDQATDAGRKSLKLDPNNTFSLIIVAIALAQPKQLKGSPQEVTGLLNEAENDANRALTLLDKLKPRPGETDEQFQQRKGALAADAHFALGSIATQRDDYEGALSQYQLAISSTNKPTVLYYYRLAEAYASIGQTPKAIEALQKASDLARGTPMQKYVDDFMAELQRSSH